MVSLNSSFVKAYSETTTLSLKLIIPSYKAFAQASLRLSSVALSSALAACAASDSDSEGDTTSANVTTTDSDTATTTEDKDFWFGWENTSLRMNAVLRNYLGATSGGKSFKPSAVPPPSDVASYRLGSGIEVLGWLDGTTIYYYANGYT